ncbi:MAG: hypothetical protein AB8B64_10555 [Granulosicoccus sp.]
MSNGFKSNNPFDPSNEEDWERFVDSLNSSQLQTLNGLICDRLDYLRNLDTLKSMNQFEMGDYIQFTDKQGQVQTGQITKFNRKTISILSSEGKKWNVSPQMLERVANPTLRESTHPFNQPGKMRTDDWVAGFTSLPGSVKSEEGYYVPDTLIWMDGDGMIRHLAVLELGKEAQAIAQSFETAIQGPDGNGSQPPATLRTDNTNLKRLLSPVFPDTKFILAEVPEIAEIAEHLAESFLNETPVARTYQDLDISPSAVAAFFEASALLYKAQPWIQIPEEGRLLGITIDKYGINDNVMTIIGQAGMSYGVLLFECLADYERYTIVVNAGDRKRLDEMPNHRVLNFIPNTELETEQRKEIMDNGWQVASHQAYPELFIPVDGRIARFPNDQDLFVFEAISYALIGLFKNPDELENCWQTGKPLHIAQQIKTDDGVVDVNIQLPVLPAGKTLDTLDALEKMALIDRSDFHDADERHRALMTEIDESYRRSPEAKNAREPGAGFTLLMEFAFNYMECSVATLLPRDLEEILYDIVPRKVMIDASEADLIIDDCAAFFRFLKREYAMQHADEHLALLNQTAKQTLHDALNDTSKFGMGKSIFAGGGGPFAGLGGVDLPAQGGGFDFPHDMAFGNGLPEIKAPKTLSSAEKKNRKKNRKASRKARKKSK